MNGLRLVLDAPHRVPLDEVLIVTVRLVNEGSTPLTTSSRLVLAEGDLDIAVQGPDGTERHADWPWPVDSALRQVELASGQAIEGAALLLTDGGLRPLFPVAGSYTLVGRFTPSPGAAVQSDPVAVLREQPSSEERRQALNDPEVVQSLTSSSAVGKEALLADLAASGPPAARLLAQLACGDGDAVRSTASDVLEQSSTEQVAASVTSVLPPGLFPGDERLEAVTVVLSSRDDSEQATALLTGRPYTPPRN